MRYPSEDGENHNLLVNESSEYVYGGKDYDKVDPVTLTWENINVCMNLEQKKSIFDCMKSKAAPVQPTKRQILKDGKLNFSIKHLHLKQDLLGGW